MLTKVLRILVLRALGVPLLTNIRLTNISRVALLSALTMPLVFGQNDAGRIVGTVTDASGAVVPNASITVVNEKTGQERKVAGDPGGAFVVPYLASSTYKVSVQG